MDTPLSSLCGGDHAKRWRIVEDRGGGGEAGRLAVLVQSLARGVQQAEKPRQHSVERVFGIRFRLRSAILSDRRTSGVPFWRVAAEFSGRRETFCNAGHQLPASAARAAGERGAEDENLCGSGLIVVVVVSVGFTVASFLNLWAACCPGGWRGAGYGIGEALAVFVLGN